MKTPIVFLTIFMVLLLSGCRNRKIESLELKNEQLQEQFDSVKHLLDQQKKINQMERMMADSNAMASKRLLDECQKKSKK